MNEFSPDRRSRLFEKLMEEMNFHPRVTSPAETKPPATTTTKNHPRAAKGRQAASTHRAAGAAGSRGCQTRHPTAPHTAAGGGDGAARPRRSPPARARGSGAPPGGGIGNAAVGGAGEPAVPAGQTLSGAFSPARTPRNPLTQP